MRYPDEARRMLAEVRKRQAELRARHEQRLMEGECQYDDITDETLYDDCLTKIETQLLFYLDNAEFPGASQLQ